MSPEERDTRKDLFSAIGSVGLLALILMGAILVLPMHPATAFVKYSVIQPTFFAMTLNKASTVTKWPSIGTLGKDNSEDWGYVEKANGTFNWSAIDNAISTAKSNRVNRFIYTILITPSWASSSGAKNAVPSVTDYDNFIRSLVTRYRGQIQYYELWNEPNNPNSWSGTVQDLLALAKSAYPLIKTIDPNATVLTPGVATGGVEPISAGCMNLCWLALYLQAGGGNYADSITWHAYRCLTGQYGDCNYGIGCTQSIQCAGEPLVTQINLVRGYMGQYGLTSKPLIDTEGGWSKNQYLADPDQQAAYVSRWFIIQAEEGINIATWYAWNGDTLQNPDGWGTLWTPTQGESQAAKAYNQTYSWLVGSAMSSPCSLSNTSVWVCNLTLPSGNDGLIVFGDSNSSAISYTPPSQFTKYQDLNGSRFPVHGLITVTMKPILLESSAGTPSISTASTTETTFSTSFFTMSTSTTSSSSGVTSSASSSTSTTIPLLQLPNVGLLLALFVSTAAVAILLVRIRRKTGANVP